MSKSADNNTQEIYTDSEEKRFEEIIGNNERIAELCRNQRGEARFDNLVFVVGFTLTSMNIPAGELETAEQRRRHLAAILRLNDPDAQFLLEIHEREKKRRPNAFPDIQKLLSEARQRIAESETEGRLH